MFPQCNRNFTVWIILKKKIIVKMVRWPEKTYLRKHHQKNLSSLQFRPSFLHFTFEIRLRYPWLPQSPIDIQYAQVFHTKNAQEALTISSPSILQNISPQEALHWSTKRMIYKRPLLSYLYFHPLGHLTHF